MPTFYFYHGLPTPCHLQHHLRSIPVRLQHHLRSTSVHLLLHPHVRRTTRRLVHHRHMQPSRGVDSSMCTFLGSSCSRSFYLCAGSTVFDPTILQHFGGLSGGGPSSCGLRVDDLAYIGRGGTNDEFVEDKIQRTSTSWVDSFFSYDAEETGPSQLGEALVPPTQGYTQEFATPAADAPGRPAHEVAPLEPFTYDQL
nr:uncharacterized protein LOC117859847 [Setaria viridis]